jgi:phosphoribosyl-ATP pyrophosphohydrolase
MKRKPKCDCHLHERQVCDICQDTLNRTLKDKPEQSQKRLNPKYGYHTVPIKKGVLGELSKIQEEFEELVDADKQGVKILIACELADLFGAIREYAKKHGLKMADLHDMAKLTRKAFEQGYR